MRRCFTIAILLISPFLLLREALSQVAANSQSQNADRSPRQLNLAEIKKRIQIYKSTRYEKNKKAVDEAIATEINQNGITGFRPTESILTELRQLGAGPQTIQALVKLVTVSTNLMEPLERQHKIVVLIADFESEGGTDYGIKDMLLGRLIESTRKYDDDVEVKQLVRKSVESS